MGTPDAANLERMGLWCTATRGGQATGRKGWQCTGGTPMICHTPVLLHVARAELCLAAAPAVLVPRPRPHLLAVRNGDETRAVLLQARVQRLLGGGIKGCEGERF